MASQEQTDNFKAATNQGKGAFVDPNAAANATKQQQFYNTVMDPTKNNVTAAHVAAGGTTVGANPSFHANNANIATGNVNQDRAAQQGQIGALNAIANGQTSSQAQMAVQQAQAGNLASSNAMAASNRNGQNAGQLMRTAAGNNAVTNSNAAAQGAQVAAQQQMAAQGMALQGNQALSGQDAGLATSQAGLVQQANLQNAGQAQQLGEYNASNTQQQALANAGYTQQAGLANQSKNLSDQQLGLQNLGLQQQTSQTQVANQMAGTAAYQSEEGITDQNAQAGNAMWAGVGGSLANAGGAGAAGFLLASDKNKKRDVSSFFDKLNIASDENLKSQVSMDFNNNPFNKIKAPPMPAMPGSNGNAGKGADALAGAAGKKLGTMLNAPATPGGSVPAGYQLNGPKMDATNPDMPQGGAGYSGLPNGGMNTGVDAGNAMNMPGAGATTGLPVEAIASDEKLKNVKKKSVDQALTEMLDKLGPAKEWEYKEEALGKNNATPGKKIGPMWQDLEKSDAGKMITKQTQDGAKVVDYGSALPMMMSSLSVLSRRLKELEAGK